MSYKIAYLVKSYQKGEMSALEVLESLKENKDEFNENYSLLIYDFDCEEKISYLLLKENFKKLAMETLEDIKSEQENETVLKTLFKMMSRIYMSNVFGVDKKFVSKAAHDAYKEVLKNDFEELEKISIELKKEQLKRILDSYSQNNESIELTKEQMKKEAELSVYSKEIIEFLDKY